MIIIIMIIIINIICRAVKNWGAASLVYYMESNRKFNRKMN